MTSETGGYLTGSGSKGGAGLAFFVLLLGTVVAGLVFGGCQLRAGARPHKSFVPGAKTGSFLCGAVKNDPPAGS